MIVLVGESASGKSSIERYMVKKYGYKNIVSYTTRPPRKGEVDGIDYHFITYEEFNNKIRDGFFAEIGQYNNWWYGTPAEECTEDKIAVLTPSGLRQLKQACVEGITAFYIRVPRRDRLIQILKRGDDIEEAYRRNLSDVGMFDGIENEVDYVIENAWYHKSIAEMANEILERLEIGIC